MLRLHALEALWVSLLLVGNCRGQNSTRRCAVEFGTLQQCGGGDGSGSNGSNNGTTSSSSWCADCVASYYRNQLNLDLGNLANDSSCALIENATCHALFFCSFTCALCEPQVVDYVACDSLCALNGTSCDDLTSHPTSPTPSPSSIECPGELDTLRQCINETGSADTCVDCLSAYFPEIVPLCATSQRLTCQMAQECPVCGPCQDEFVSYVNCRNADVCTPINCTSAATLLPTNLPEACQSSATTLETCLDDQGDFSENCPACVEELYQRLLGDPQRMARSALQCSTIQAELCDATTSLECDCGSCATAYQDLLQCRVEQQGDVDCAFSCQGNGGGGNGGVTPSHATARRFPANANLLVAILLFFVQ